MINKQQQVYDLLMMPIVCDNRNRNQMERKDGVILTGQKYCSSYVDEDMSDYAVGFYEILYGHLWGDQPMLDNKGNIIDWEYAGDSMNSFETTANRTPGAGKAKNQRPPETEWPEFLRIYYHTWHCLANFWILPMETGRTLKGSLNKAITSMDYMDRYLNVIRNSVLFNGKERKYHNSFSNWNDFIEKHFLKSGYFDGNEIISISAGTPDEFTKGAIKAMRARADEISKSEFMIPLWDYFNRKRLIG